MVVFSIVARFGPPNHLCLSAITVNFKKWKTHYDGLKFTWPICIGPSSSMKGLLAFILVRWTRALGISRCGAFPLPRLAGASGPWCGHEILFPAESIRSSTLEARIALVKSESRQKWAAKSTEANIPLANTDLCRKFLIPKGTCSAFTPESDLRLRF